MKKLLLACSLFSSFTTNASEKFPPVHYSPYATSKFLGIMIATLAAGYAINRAVAYITCKIEGKTFTIDKEKMKISLAACAVALSLSYSLEKDFENSPYKGCGLGVMLALFFFYCDVDDPLYS